MLNLSTFGGVSEDTNKEQFEVAKGLHHVSIIHTDGCRYSVYLNMNTNRIDFKVSRLNEACHYLEVVTPSHLSEEAVGLANIMVNTIVFILLNSPVRASTIQTSRAFIPYLPYLDDAYLAMLNFELEAKVTNPTTQRTNILKVKGYDVIENLDARVRMSDDVTLNITLVK